MDIVEIEKKYISFFEKEPTDPSVIQKIERLLSIVLPKDFKAISKFYRGGILGGKSHHSIDRGGEVGNMFDETVRLRQEVALPLNMLVLAEPAESLIVMETKDDEAQDARVIWLDSTDVANLNDISSLRNPDIWESYSAFFEYLLDEEEEEREY